MNKTASNIVQSADHVTAVGTAVVRYGLVVVITLDRVDEIHRLGGHADTSVHLA